MYNHDIEFNRHIKTVQANKKYSRKDRSYKNLITWAVRPFAKRLLHKINRRITGEALTSYTYYKNRYSLKDVVYALT